MVKLGAPLFSLAASGSLADAITYSNIHGKPYLKKKSKTPNPRTDAQISTRAMFSWLSGAWTGLSQPDKDSWNVLSALNNQSPFNAFIAFNTGRWHNFLAPSKTPNAAEAGTPSERRFSFGAYYTNYFRLTTTSVAVNDGWGAIIFIGDLPDFTPTRDKVILIIDDHDAAVRYFNWQFPNAPDRRFKLRTFTADGYSNPTYRSYTVYT